MTDKCILVADNDPDFLKTQVEFLSRPGFRVLPAPTLDEVRRLLRDVHVHLMVLDIRMENDDSDRDFSGLNLAKEKMYLQIPKIIMTNYPTFAAVKEALGPAIDGLPAAVDFVDKHEMPESLLAAVDKAFARLSYVDSPVRLRLKGLLTFSGLAERIEPGLRSSSLIIERASEVEELFRYIFHDRVEVILSPIGQGRSGAAVVQAMPVSTTGPERQLIVKCGQCDVICREKERYEQFVKRFVGALSTQIANFAETFHFAAIAYTIVGGRLEDTKSFADYYQESDVPGICTALDYLFTETCDLWYQQKPHVVEDKILNAVYRKQMGLEDTHREKGLLEIVEELRRQAGSLDLKRIERIPASEPKDPPKIVFSFSDGSKADGLDPTTFAYHDRKVFGPPVLLGITHGDLNGDNIRVAKDGRAWLTDFEQTDRGPVLRDFVQMETAIKIDMLRTTKLSDLAHFEQQLAAPYHFSDPVQLEGIVSGDLRKAASVISHLREIAGKVTGSDMQQYYLGLLFCATQVILGRGSLPSFGLGRPEYARRAHAFLAAAMVARKLEEWNEEKAAASGRGAVPAPAETIKTQPIYIDAGGDVWVEGKKAESLSPLEFKLLAYFLTKPNVLCTRDEIIAVLYPGSDPGDISDDAVNSVVERLRKRIERGHKPPKYIVTKRGHGYKLEMT